MAKRNGVVVAFDLDYRDGTWDNDDETSIYFTLTAQQADMVLGTREEFDKMEELFHPGNHDDDRSAHWLLEKGVSLVSIKQGKKGSHLYTAEGRTMGGIYPTKVLKSFGAGDSYSGSFNNALIRGKSLEEALKLLEQEKVPKEKETVRMLDLCTGCLLYTSPSPRDTR